MDSEGKFEVGFWDWLSVRKHVPGSNRTHISFVVDLVKDPLHELGELCNRTFCKVHYEGEVFRGMLRRTQRSCER